MRLVRVEGIRSGGDTTRSDPLLNEPTAQISLLEQRAHCGFYIEESEVGRLS